MQPVLDALQPGQIGGALLSLFLMALAPKAMRWAFTALETRLQRSRFKQLSPVLHSLVLAAEGYIQGIKQGSRREQYVVSVARTLFPKIPEDILRAQVRAVVYNLNRHSVLSPSTPMPPQVDPGPFPPGGSIQEWLAGSVLPADWMVKQVESAAAPLRTPAAAPSETTLHASELIPVGLMASHEPLPDTDGDGIPDAEEVVIQWDLGEPGSDRGAVSSQPTDAPGKGGGNG